MHTYIPGSICVVCGQSLNSTRYTPSCIQLSDSPSLWTDAHDICTHQYTAHKDINIKAARAMIVQAPTATIASCIVAIAQHTSVLQQALNRFPNLQVQWGNTTFASGKRPPLVPTLHHPRKLRYAETQQMRCAITGLDLDIGPFVGHNSPSWEHIIPRSLGGANHISNMIITSYQANLDRRNLQMKIHDDIRPMVWNRLAPAVQAFLALPHHRVARASQRSAYRKSNKTTRIRHPWYWIFRGIGMDKDQAMDAMHTIELTPHLIHEHKRGLDLMTTWIHTHTPSIHVLYTQAIKRARDRRAWTVG